MRRTEGRVDDRATSFVQSPVAQVDGDTLPAIDNDTRIWHHVHIMAGARVGARCTLGEGAHVGLNVVIGNGCKIQNGAQLFEGVTLEDEVFVGPHVVFTNVLTPRAAVSRKDAFESTLVKRGASIGANATILCGVTIGEYAIVGAGSVVTKHVEPHEVVVGVPARPHGWACRCGEMMLAPVNLVYQCPACSDRYEHREGVPGLVPFNAETTT